MAELPDDAIEAECEREDCQRIAATASDVYCQITGGLLSYPTYDARTILAHADEQTQKLVDEECARVRAAAVADERQRIKGALERLIASETPGLFSWTAWRVEALREALKVVAACSVPVATPKPDSVAELAKSCGECTEGGLGNCRHGCRERSDPTYGRIDPDIQRAVDELEPESIGSRVAMENTLQARRDAATPTGP